MNGIEKKRIRDCIEKSEVSREIIKDIYMRKLIEIINSDEKVKKLFIKELK
jgi:hypothetical protein